MLNARLFACLMSIALLIQSAEVLPRVLFDEDFEAGSIDASPNPVYAWKPPYSESNPNNGMMYGVEDVYWVTSEFAYRGGHSLRMNFGGRNSFCNVCGVEEVPLTTQDSCVSVTGTTWGDSIYNKNNGYSRWRVTENRNGRLCFDSSSPLASSVWPDAVDFESGDSILIPYVCGVNGVVGGNRSRRSDCNRAINYLDHVSASDVPFGGTLARRFYMYIPSETDLPGTTLKLGYTHWRRNGGVSSIKLKLSVQRGLQLELNTHGGTIVPDYYVPKDTWVYFEELFIRESAEGARDGRYVLYYGDETDDLTTPVVDMEGLTIGELVDVSIHGNWQHFNVVSGYVYFDDIVIADTYIGPVGSTYTGGPPPGLGDVVVDPGSGSDPGDGGSDPGDGGSDPGDGGSDPGDGGSDPGDGDAGSDPGDGGGVGAPGGGDAGAGQCTPPPDDDIII